MPKFDKETIRQKKLEADILHGHKYKNSKTFFGKLNPAPCKKDNTV